MNNRNARRLPLVVALVLVTSSPAPAQLKRIQLPFHPAPYPPDSHRLLDGTPDSLEAALSDRLRQLREGRELQELAKRLLGDTELSKKLKGISLDDLKGLQEKVAKGQSLGSDERFRQFIDTVREHHSAEDAEKLKRWAESQKPPEITSPPPVPHQDPVQLAPGSTPGAVPPPVMPPTPPPKPASAWSDFKDRSTSWLRERMTDFPDGVANLLDNLGEGDLGESVRDALRSLGRGEMDADNLPFDVQKVFRDLAGTWSELADHLPSDPVPWEGIRSLFQDLHAPSLPSVEGPAVSPGSVSAGGEGFGMAWLWLAVLAVFAFILYRSVDRRRAAGGEAGWRLGPWPVAPGAVATRGDLVAAFEYLAFLCLGPSARTCNHLDVADLLGEQTPDAERRRAAGELAHLYEQARYAPVDESLTETDLAAARRDLCLLAGVATA